MITIIGGHHQGYTVPETYRHGDQIQLPITDTAIGPPGAIFRDFEVVQYMVKRFYAGDSGQSILYAAPADWDDLECFIHLIKQVQRK